MWHSISLPNGISSLSFDKKDSGRNRLYVGTLEGGIYALDLTLWHPEYEFAKSKIVDSTANGMKKTTIWQVKPLPQCRDILVASSGDGSMAMWKYEDPKSECRVQKDGDSVEYHNSGKFEHVPKVKVSQQTICAFDLHSERQGLGVQCSLDQVVRVLVFTKLDEII